MKFDLKAHEERMRQVIESFRNPQPVDRRGTLQKLLGESRRRPPMGRRIPGRGIPEIKGHPLQKPERRIEPQPKTELPVEIEPSPLRKIKPMRKRF